MNEASNDEESRINWNPEDEYRDKKVAEEYDRVRFNSFAGRLFDRLEKRAVGKALRGIAQDALVLDCPTGTGRHAEVLLEAGYRVHGVDISQQMIDVARRKLERFGERFTTASGRIQDFLPEPDMKFDAGICIRILMHLPLAEQIGFLQAVAALVDGPIIFNQGLDTWHNRLRRGLKRMLGHQPSAGHPISHQELSKLVEGAGLKITRTHYVMPLVSEAIVVRTEKI